MTIWFFSTIPLTSYLTSNKILLQVHTHIHMFTKANGHTEAILQMVQALGGREKVGSRFYMVLLM